MDKNDCQKFHAKSWHLYKNDKIFINKIRFLMIIKFMEDEKNDVENMHKSPLLKGGGARKYDAAAVILPSLA